MLRVCVVGSPSYLLYACLCSVRPSNSLCAPRHTGREVKPCSCILVDLFTLLTPENLRGCLVLHSDPDYEQARQARKNIVCLIVSIFSCALLLFAFCQ
ncbi:hypothetical protein PILCRDRAFT_305988 [Piloderma croceum F 1598]|uniref:Uncharacterized protein n=1 Tax=Piloderma croceum (strain F 1598) TaxID=765440 RepID=A0A0C3CC55_PILCF|nr:hypothetical protein PILCRDRAFT_305988 [Piloderma croceum F 1598]